MWAKMASPTLLHTYYGCELESSAPCSNTSTVSRLLFLWVRWNGYRYDDAPDEEDEETEERSRQGEIGSGQIVME